MIFLLDGRVDVSRVSVRPHCICRHMVAYIVAACGLSVPSNVTTLCVDGGGSHTDILLAQTILGRFVFYTVP